ncbi:MAG: hypothetical protein E6J09_09820 [Chloroflexi bacterium]|nr:MAG: hypothetical protein E6J09_09820 [Chloroflexota bacterium]
MRIRALVIAVAACSLLACGAVASLVEPSPGDLLQKASANLKTAKTTHIDGTGSFALKDGMNVSFDFKMAGEAEVPDKARLSMQMTLLGQPLSIDTISIGGRTYTKGLQGDTWTEATSTDPTSSGMLDPLGQTDLSGAVSVAEIDRPEVDGKKTRHLKYTVDPQKLLGKMQGASGVASFAPSNVNGSGEVWVRTEDTQIVRQLVKLSFDIEGNLGLATGGTPSPSGKGTFEMSFDLHFSQIGQPITPAITAPPTR